MSSDNELFDRINQVVDQRIRPALAQDGGSLDVLGLDGKVLTIRFQGACGSCPHAATGTMVAIQNVLRESVDSQIEVVSA